MTQEEKQLLLIDLCARHPYGIKVLYEGNIETIQYLEPQYNEVLLEGFNYTVSISDIKPYLRSLSSMTKEERIERIAILLELEGHIDEDITYKYQDWLLAHHLDFRNLIEKGLALEAPEGMYDFLWKD